MSIVDCSKNHNRVAACPVCQDRDGIPIPRTQEPVSALGYVNWEYRFLQNASGRIFVIDLHDLNRNLSMEALELRLLGLAPLEYWQKKFPPRNGGTTWELAVDWLLRQGEKVGVFNWKASR